MKRSGHTRKTILWGLSATVLLMVVALGGVQTWAASLGQLMITGLVFLWCWRMNNRSGWRLKGTPLDGPIWAFVTLAGVSTYVSIYPYASILALAQILASVAAYYLAAHCLDGPHRTQFHIMIIVIGSGLSLLGVGQSLFELNHSWWNNPHYLSATFVNHSHFAGFLEMAMALAIGLLLGLEREDVDSSFDLTKWRFMLIGSLGLMGTAFLMSQSRGGWGAFAAALVCGSVVLTRRRLLPSWTLWTFIGGLLFFILFLGLGEDRIAYRLHTFEAGRESDLFTGRVEIWEPGLRMAADHPWTGTGIGTFRWAFPRYRPDGFTVTYHHAHNDYLQIATEAGLLALPVMLWGIIILLRRGLSRQKGEHRLQEMTRWGAGVGLLSLMLHGLVDFNFHIPANALVFACLAGTVMSPRKAEVERKT